MQDRLAKLHVIVADRDHRTATLVQKVLFSFGFRNLDLTHNGESALLLLRNRPYDLIITEWNMEPINGVELVKAIRGAKEDDVIRRDIPIIMLTAQADKQSVSTARDAGITEFVAKPFSAKTLSTRIIQIIDNPRVFVESRDFTGPCRRRRGEPPPGIEDRRAAGRPKEAIITPANATLKKQLAVNNASEILNEQVIQAAQQELLKAEDEFIEWAKDDITRLEKAYDYIVAHPGDVEATRQLYEAAYAIKSQAGIFGYPLGAEIATLMIEYLEAHEESLKNTQTVIRKHIDTMSIVFRQKVKESGQGIALDMMFSLKKLIEKLS